MSKSNVNPNHYKVAGRERQGEDIAQARNKQKHAENVARRRTEIGARSQKPAPQPDAAPTRAAKTATRKARATPLQAPPGRKRGHNLVPGGSGPHARFPRAPRVPVLRPAGAAPRLPAKQATKKASVKKKPSVKLQASDKRTKRSAAKKRATSRDHVGALPATGAVGMLGRGLPRRRLEPRT